MKDKKGMYDARIEKMVEDATSPFRGARERISMVFSRASIGLGTATTLWVFYHSRVCVYRAYGGIGSVTMTQAQEERSHRTRDRTRQRIEFPKHRKDHRQIPNQAWCLPINVYHFRVFPLQKSALGALFRDCFSGFAALETCSKKHTMASLHWWPARSY